LTREVEITAIGLVIHPAKACLGFRGYGIPLRPGIV
jgi:hypothetical protein